MSAINLACGDGRLEEVKTLIERGEDVNKRSGGSKSTAIEYALRNKQFDIARWLLDNTTIDISSKEGLNHTILHYACIHGADTDLIQSIFLKMDSEMINQKTDAGFTPIALAAFYCNLHIVRYLIELKATARWAI